MTYYFCCAFEIVKTTKVVVLYIIMLGDIRKISRDNSFCGLVVLPIWQSGYANIVFLAYVQKTTRRAFKSKN